MCARDDDDDDDEEGPYDGHGILGPSVVGELSSELLHATFALLSFLDVALFFFVGREGGGQGGWNSFFGRVSACVRERGSKERSGSIYLSHAFRTRTDCGPALWERGWSWLLHRRVLTHQQLLASSCLLQTLLLSCFSLFSILSSLFSALASLVISWPSV